jgi:peptidoglycan hydrolase-like protein with peptidoglycan-binding domain
MKSLTLMTVCVAMAAIVEWTGAAMAGERGENSWWQRLDSSNSGFGTISNIAGSKGGKAVTKTEVFAGKSVPPMVSPSSDKWMDDAIARYEMIVSRGGWPEVSGSRLARGNSGPEVVKLGQRLAAEGYLPPESLSASNPQEYSDAVLNAVAQFQANHGLAVTGKVDKATAAAMNVSASERLAALRANAPRLREYSKGLGPRYIIVNVPALQLEAVNFNSVFSRHNIIAGQPSRPTPVTITQVSDINFNPYWNAPISIVEKDIIPRVQKEGTRVLRDMGMRIYDGYNGPEVNPDDIDWDSVPPDRFFFRQDPGEENAMATVKINFPSPFGIYLHDTPTKNLFTTGARYLSSGCIRVEQIHTLVNWILNGQDGWNSARIEQVAGSRDREDVKVIDGPQLRTVYLTAWPSGNGLVNFRDDIYDLDRTAFVVGQPLPPGETSDDGQRFILKPVVREASAAPDDGDYFKPRRRSSSFGFFSTRRERDSSATRSASAGSSKLIPGARERESMILTNFFNGNQTVDQPALKPAKSKTANAKQKQKRKLFQTLQPGGASVGKAAKTASAKKKPLAASKKKSAAASETAAAVKKPAKATAPEATVDQKKKKKKITTAASDTTASADKPVFTQQ